LVLAIVGRPLWRDFLKAVKKGQKRPKMGVFELFLHGFGVYGPNTW
jgi:hypothetical protein